MEAAPHGLARSRTPVRAVNFRIPSSHPGTEASPTTPQVPMSDAFLGSDGAKSSAPRHTIADRVLARVHDAGLAVDRRTSATRPRAPRRRPKPDPLAASVTRTPAQVREARSLRSVFLDLGDSYRDYRHRTGAPVAADVRAAADRFRRELDVTSLVAVATLLDGLDILTW